MNRKLIRLTMVLVVLIFVIFAQSVFAHSGRTDGNGGHKDNNNKSGLGGYHYHHGHGPHLHNGGICPFTSVQEVKPVTIDVESVKINNSNDVTLDIGDEKILQVGFVPSNVNDKTLYWQSEDNNVVTVSNSGVIKAIGSGSATITATSVNGKRSSILVSVNYTIDEIIINEEDLLLKIGDSKQLNISTLPDNAIQQAIYWKSSNEQVATVDNNGKVMAISEGITEISASISDAMSFSIQMEVSPVNLLAIEENDGDNKLDLSNQNTFKNEGLLQDISNRDINDDKFEEKEKDVEGIYAIFILGGLTILLYIILKSKR